MKRRDVWINGLHVGSISEGTVNFNGEWVILAYKGNGEPCGVCDSVEQAIDRLNDIARIALLKYQKEKGKKQWKLQ